MWIHQTTSRKGIRQLQPSSGTYEDHLDTKLNYDCCHLPPVFNLSVANQNILFLYKLFIEANTFLPFCYVVLFKKTQVGLSYFIYKRIHRIHVFTKKCNSKPINNKLIFIAAVLIRFNRSFKGIIKFGHQSVAGRFVPVGTRRPPQLLGINSLEYSRQIDCHSFTPEESVLQSFSAPVHALLLQSKFFTY